MSDHARITPDGRRGLDHHVYPIEDRQHDTVGLACWCEPHLYRLCTQCDGKGGCWLCSDDGVERVESLLPGDRGLIVHHFIADDIEMIDGR